MPRQIQDEFSALPISRQRRYQLRREKAGLCRVCGKPAAKGLNGRTIGLCAKHERIQAVTCLKARDSYKRGAEFI
jgi:hypothetical protein